MNSNDLREGDILFLRYGGRTPVRRIRLYQAQTRVCSLSLRQLHSFTVGECQVLVHNEGGACARVTGEALAKLRREFNAMKPKAWMAEALKNPQKYTPSQLARMHKGKPPMGSDGYPMEVHHKKPLTQGGSNTFDNFDFMTQTEHRRGPNFKKNHPDLFSGTAFSDYDCNSLWGEFV